ncbi:Hypothetical protein POVN_LOCUS715 [uncultured virus]|nr:Hypothetical protein POVN_LOCUS715 [uncultured virus]
MNLSGCQVLAGYVSVLAVYTTLATLSTGCPWYSYPLTFFLMGCTFFGTHVAGHYPIVHAWFKAHYIGHHIYEYPRDNFDGPVYRKNKYDKWKLNMWAYIITTTPVFLLCLKLWTTTWPQVIALHGLILGPLWLENYVHMEVHSNVSKWKTWPWYIYLKEYHNIHHTKHRMRKNFAIVAVFFDDLFGTAAHPT